MIRAGISAAQIPSSQIILSVFLPATMSVWIRWFTAVCFSTSKAGSAAIARPGARAEYQWPW